MRLIALRSLAAISLALALLPGATRPHYGGTLRVQISDALPSLEPGEPARDRVVGLVAETLVDLDSRGLAQPKLAVAWTHDAGSRRWSFTLRPRVVFHDGSALNVASAAAALSGVVKNLTVEAAGTALVFDSPVPRPGLLEELAGTRYAIYKRTPEVPMVGTGPFRLNPWLPGAPVILTAFEEHWAGRPYLDGIHFDTRHAAVPDIVELAVNVNARTLSEKLRLEPSPPVELFAVVLPRESPPTLREALTLSVDRAAIVNVLFQKRGEATAALLPQWLSGYAFLFPVQMDLNRARQLAAGFRQSLTLSYAPGDPLARSVAERIALNARDVGLIVQTTSGPAQARLVRMAVVSTNPAQALAEMAAALGDAEPIGDPYESERALLDRSRVVPIAHIPRIYGVHTRVRDYVSGGRLDNVWIAP